MSPISFRKQDDLYDRIAHNLYSINYVWALVAGFLVMFMQAGFMYGGDWLMPGEKLGSHISHELDDLSARLPRVLGLRLCHRLGQLVERACGSRMVSPLSVPVFRC